MTAALAVSATMRPNLIDNAIRYNLPGGSIEVRTQTNRDHAVLTVANTGPPIPADQVDRLFQPFQRLIPELTAGRRGHPDGHGLGLSIVSAIATAHGAVLRTRPRPGGGLTVEARFPPTTGRKATAIAARGHPRGG